MMEKNKQAKRETFKIFSVKVKSLGSNLGETGLIFDAYLWDESGDQVSSFDEKKPTSKISGLDTFN